MGIKCFLVEQDEQGHYRNPETGEVYRSHHDLPPGAMWYWHFITSETDPRSPMNGPDGKCLVVMLPNGREWLIDGCASNCTDREGFNRGEHKCWVRHGTPPLITVDKNGKTCAAGGGSIQSGDWHGFLRNGELVK